jgi:protein-S-isoprenylcysteine O-methyltransferase Ste14
MIPALLRAGSDPGIERRFYSSRIPAALVVLGDALVSVGYYIIFLALRENRWAASIIEVRPGQRVISTGLYGVIRHPMYSGGVLMIFATPLAWGSLWAFGCALLLCGSITARLLDEERYLSKNLPGYTEYCRRVPYRLIPYLW